MTNGRFQVRVPQNEPVRSYAPGTPERAALKRTLAALAEDDIDIPLHIGGKEVRTGRTSAVTVPHAHAHRLGTFHKAGAEEVHAAIEAAEEARPAWAAMPWEERASIFLRAAELLAGPWRDRVNASTMLGQSKTAHQAEIDAACELADFWRFNAHFVERLHSEQPISSPGTWNRLEYRPLDGYVFAVTPFNFTSIAGNLPTAPAMLGNTVVWKPASTAVYSGSFLMRLLEDAGLPPGVINFVPGSGAEVGDPAIEDGRLGGVHFTGSTEVFQDVWEKIGRNIKSYAQYPRLVGETGGKDFVFAHPSADVESLATGLVRGAFEYQGQKCSAASRAYVPKSLWSSLRDCMGDMLAEVKVGDVRDFRNFMGAGSTGELPEASGVIERTKKIAHGSSSSSAESATAPRAGSCNRPSSRSPTPSTTACGRSSSARSSRSTCTTTRATRRRSACATRPPATRSPAPSSPRTAPPSPTRASACASPRATST